MQRGLAWVDVFHLILKDNKKELEPKHFNEEEKQEFDKADLAEWRQWIVNKAVERIPHRRGEAHLQEEYHHGTDALCQGEQGQRQSSGA